MLLWACVVHAFFISRVLLAIPERAMLRSGWELIIFYPHTILMISLPPGYPFDDQIVNNWKIVGKIVDAFPASLVYGAVIALVLRCLLDKIQKTRKV
jgi:hypothetical protein